MSSPLVVDFDRQIFDRQVVGGISRYFADLIGALDADRGLGVEPRVCVRATQNRYLRLPEGKPLLRLPDRRGVNRVADMVNRRCRAGTADLVHHTYYDPRWLDRLSDSVRVTTVHDMIPEALPELFAAGNPHSGKDAYLQASQLVVAVSETTRSELMRLRPSLAATVVVIPEAADPVFSPRALAKTCDLPPATLLYVGGRSGYKRFHLAPLALAEVRRAGIDAVLYCVGGGDFTAAERAFIGRLELDGAVRQAEVSDATLASWYRQATALVVTAAAEGFGLPIVEAMQSGCPAVVPHASVFPEVAGDAGQYYESGEAGELAHAVAGLVLTSGLREHLIQAGLARAATYSWRRTAELTAAAYHAAMGSTLVTNGGGVA